jgi:hypothetical protein
MSSFVADDLTKHDEKRRRCRNDGRKINIWDFLIT